jgi:hypothetical protein
MQVSVTLSLADFLRSRGYDVRWHATDTVDANVVDAAHPKAEVTLVPDFPANPSFIVRLKSDSASSDEIVVPALSVHALPGPKRVRHIGIGHSDWEWERHVLVDGLAADDFQQRELADLLHDWLNSEWRKPVPISDYDTDPTTPTPLEPAYVDFATVDRDELYTENDAARYYVRADAMLRYVE